MTAQTRRTVSRIVLAVSLLMGTAVNLNGARGFVVDPLRTADRLGLPLTHAGTLPGSRPVRSAILFLHLNAVLLAILAAYYAIVAIHVWTAQSAASYAHEVAFAIFARLSGVLFYAVTLGETERPQVIVALLVVNLGLASLHAAFLGAEGWMRLLRRPKEMI